MKIKIYLLVLLGCLILTSKLMYAESIRYGGESGWGRTLSRGLRQTDGWKGEAALTLAPLGRNPFDNGDGNPDAIDILLLSEPEGLENPTARYRVNGNYQISSHISARSNTSIRPGSGGLKLYPSPNAMWFPGSNWGDFTLQFLLRPTTLRDGEVFFSWDGRDALGEAQSVVAQVEKRRLVWTFHRFFRLGTDRALTLTLVSPPLIPGEWRHHRIRFKQDALPPDKLGTSPGFLEYLVDGIPSDAVHATRDGREGSEVFAPRIGSLSNQPLLLAPDFSGYLDEFQLASTAMLRSPTGSYVNHESSTYGVGRTEAVSAGHPESAFHGIRARFDTPGHARIRFFIQAFDSLSDAWHVDFPDPDNPDWEELAMKAQPEDPMGFGRWFIGVPDQPVTGHYFIVGYVLHPDPSTDTAPVFSVLELNYNPHFP